MNIKEIINSLTEWKEEKEGKRSVILIATDLVSEKKEETEDEIRIKQDYKNSVMVTGDKQELIYGLKAAIEEKEGKPLENLIFEAILSSFSDKLELLVTKLKEDKDNE